MEIHELKELIEVQLKGISDNLLDLKKENSDNHVEMMKKQDYTNGSVRTLKEWKAKVEGGMAASYKGVMIISSVIVIMAGMIGTLLKVQIDRIEENIDLKIQKYVANAIEQNNDKYFIQK